MNQYVFFLDGFFVFGKDILHRLSRLSDVRHAALSELSNGKRENINFSHIERIAEALNIEDIREIIDLVEE